jgi:hypothetical protein
MPQICPRVSDLPGNLFSFSEFLYAESYLELIIAILLKYFHCSEDEMDMEGLAAARMEARMCMYLACRDGPDGQM